MMKSVVRSNSESETKIAMQNWEDLFAKEKLTYVEPHLRIKPKVIEIAKQDHPHMQVVASET
jgi:hypothetical protein